MKEMIESQTAVWASGPTDKDEKRLLLVLDLATGVLSARTEADERDRTTGRIMSTMENVSLSCVLELDDPRLFATKLRHRLDVLMSDDTLPSRSA
ncbi:hypothetical protein [Hyphomonas sp.]|uniref:hypothetical protein n=1 Tax=Hyphomonas sp. TaxID=87 RepID=UPI003D2B1563